MMDTLDQLNLQPRIRMLLENAHIKTTSLLLKASTDDLLKANLTKAEIQAVRTTAVKISNVEFMTALSACDLSAFQRLSVGCPKLDKFLRGGVAVRGITEIVGESGSGKTQLCLQMSLMVQYPLDCGGLGGGAVYICTEDAFPSVRLQQLSHTFLETDMAKKYDAKEIRFGDNIFIEHLPDAESLKQCISVRLPQLLNRSAIKLIVIDSIAGVFRADYEPNSGASRAKDLQYIGIHLHKLAQKFDIAVVCVNQVTDIVSKDESLSKHKSVAALGLAWANLVTTRLQLSRMSQQIRTMEIIFSPCLSRETIHFSITEKGVTAIL